MTQEEIILACTHDHQPCEVNLGQGQTAKCCCDCWNASVEARMTKRKKRIQAQKELGITYWTEKGIQVGDEVTKSISSLLFGSVAISGTAKVGASGAYVFSNYQKGQLSPEGWVKK